MKRGRGQEGDKGTGERRDKKGEQTGKRRRKGKEGEKEYVGDHGLLGILEEHVTRDTNPLRIQGSGPRVQVSRGNFALCRPYLNPRSTTCSCPPSVIIGTVVCFGFVLSSYVRFPSRPRSAGNATQPNLTRTQRARRRGP